MMPRQKSLICQLGNREVCVEQDSLFNPDCKVIIKDLSTIKRKGDEYVTNLENGHYGLSTESSDEGENSCVSSGRNSPTPMVSNTGRTILNFGIKNGEKSGNSSGYESGYVTPTRYIKKKRKLSKRKELLLTNHIEQFEETEQAKIHKPHLSAEQIASSEDPQSSDIDIDIDSTSSDDDQSNEEQPGEVFTHSSKKTNDAFTQELIRQLSKTSPEIPIVELRDQEASTTGMYIFGFKLPILPEIM